MQRTFIHTVTILARVTAIALLALNASSADREVDSRRSSKPSTTITVKPLTPQQRRGNETATQQPVTGVTQDASGTVKVDSSQNTSTTIIPNPSLVVAPMTGEHIGWMVFSGGGGRVTSASNAMNLTIGQSASGTASSGSFKINLGFLQEFSPGSCCIGTTGNVNMAGIVDLGDLSALVSYLTGGGYVLPCTLEANVNNGGIVDLGDLSALVSYLTGGGYVLPNCP